MLLKRNRPSAVFPPGYTRQHGAKNSPGFRGTGDIFLVDAQASTIRNMHIYLYLFRVF